MFCDSCREELFAGPLPGSSALLPGLGSGQTLGTFIPMTARCSIEYVPQTAPSALNIILLPVSPMPDPPDGSSSGRRHGTAEELRWSTPLFGFRFTWTSSKWRGTVHAQIVSFGTKAPNSQAEGLWLQFFQAVEAFPLPWSSKS